MDELSVTIPALKQKDGSYIINLKDNGSYLVNGIPFEISWNTQKIITFESIPTIQEIKKTTSIVSYKNILNDEMMGIDEYEDNIKNLSKCKMINDDGESYWAKENLDEEYEYKKFKNKYIPIYKTFEEVSTNFKIVVKNKIYSDNSFIIPFEHVGGKITENIFMYDSVTSQMKMIHDIAKKYGYTYYEKDHIPSKVKVEGTYTYPTHSNLRYLRISGVYVINDDWVKLSKTINGSYDVCLSAYNRDYEFVNKLFIFDKDKNSKIDGVTVNEIFLKIKSISNLANKIEVKVKCRSEYRALISNINECLKLLEPTFKENE